MFAVGDMHTPLIFETGLSRNVYDINIAVALGDDATEICYWRKFNALHGWMENLYRLKYGTKESFNCTTLRLDARDLDCLEMDTGNNKLVPINGFFFGAQEIDSEDLESVATFVKVARQAIADGKAVFYDSWW